MTAVIEDTLMHIGRFRTLVAAAGNLLIMNVTELLDVGVNPLNQSATFTVTHFSGYIVASGRHDQE